MERKDIEEEKESFHEFGIDKESGEYKRAYTKFLKSKISKEELFKAIKLTESIETLLRFLSKRDEMSMLVSKAYCFAHLNCDVEPKNQEYQKMLATVMSLIQQSSVKLVFVDNEIVENDETVREYLKDKQTKIETLKKRQTQILLENNLVLKECQNIILMKKRTKHRYFCFVLKIYLLSGFLKLNTIASSLSNKYFESDVSVFIGSISAELLVSVKSTFP